MLTVAGVFQNPIHKSTFIFLYAINGPRYRFKGYLKNFIGKETTYHKVNNMRPRWLIMKPIVFEDRIGFMNIFCFASRE